jgi:hypothetical protein
VFEQIKDLKRAHDVWKRLEESYEGTKAMKGAKLYVLKDKYTSFKMKEDETVVEMFYRLQTIVNDLNSLGEKVEDKDISHRFLRCLPPRFDTLVTILVRDGLDTMTPNQVLCDVVTQNTYHVERDGGIKEEDEDKKKKSVAFKARHIIQEARAKQRKKYQVMMMMQATLMMRLWLSL